MFYKINLIINDFKKYVQKRRIENEMAEVAAIHNEQNKDLEQMQLRLAQAYGLEDTVKRQELIIEKLETLVHNLITNGASSLTLAELNEE